MDYSNLHAKELFEIFAYSSREILKRKNETSEKLSFIDKQINEVAHEIENTAFNAVEGYKYAKEFQRLRMYRRMIKEEKYFMSALHSCFDKRSLSSLKGFEGVLNRILIGTNSEWSNYEKLGKPEYSKLQKMYEEEKLENKC